MPKIGEIPSGSSRTGSPNRAGVGYSRWFSTNISQYLRNGARYELVCAVLIGAITIDLEWPLTTPNHHIFDILYRLSCLRSGWRKTVSSLHLNSRRVNFCVVSNILGLRVGLTCGIIKTKLPLLSFCCKNHCFKTAAINILSSMQCTS